MVSVLQSSESSKLYYKLRKVKSCITKFKRIGRGQKLVIHVFRRCNISNITKFRKTVLQRSLSRLFFEAVLQSSESSKLYYRLLGSKSVLQK